MGKLEADVKRSIYKKLINLETMGYILWTERLQSGQIHNGNQHIYMSRSGTPDFIVVMINKEGRLTVIFIEAKKEGVFELRSGVQAEWRAKYGGLHSDMIYIIAQSVSEVSGIINTVGIDHVARMELK